MKKEITLGLFMALQLCLFGQAPVCMPDIPDPNYIGCYPPPQTVDIDTMENGVYYEFVFTIVVPDSLQTQGFDLDMDSIVINTSNAVSGLPNGVNYACNPADGNYPDDTYGCLVLYGTPNATPGNYSIEIDYCMYFNHPVLPFVCATFPDSTFTGGSGDAYVFRVANPSSTKDEHDDILAVKSQPNPFVGQTTISFTAIESGTAFFNVNDYTGKMVYETTLQAVKGQVSSIDFLAKDLPAGVYFYSIRLGENLVTRKLVLK